MFHLWSAGTCGSKLHIAFKLLRDGPTSGGSSDHPIVSTHLTDINHPFVDYVIDGVIVRALVDTGSMKYFVSQNVQRVIDFNDSLLDKSNAQKCVSITGDNLNILGQICTVVKFSNSKITYPSDFLVSDNIQYECVLGWDFISRNKLSLSKGPGKGYFLVGRHGKTSIRDNLESTTASLVGVTHTREQHSSTDRMLCQSTFQSNAAVALLESAIIPPRTEMILEGKLAKTANSKIGMIEPRSGITTDARQGFSLARIVVKPDQQRVVPLRVINMSQTPFQLIAGENIADFCPLVKSCSKVQASQKLDVCGAVQSDLSKTFLDKVNAVIDSTPTCEDKERVQRLMYKYSDVFDDKLGHTKLVTHIRLIQGTISP
jgi:dUTPase